MSQGKAYIKDLIRRNSYWLKSPGQLMLGVLVSWLAISLYFLGIWLIAVNLDLAITYIQVAGITVIAYLVTLLPISINGYGLREVTITALYTFFGYPIEAAISLAIVTRLLYLTTSLIGAVWLPEYLSYLGKRPPSPS